jgi:hypothetical protein
MDKRNRGRRTRTGTAKRGAPRAAASAKRSRDELPDLASILGRFSDALSLLAVAHRSLSVQEFAGVGDEEITLRRVIDELKAVYDEIDAAVPLLGSTAAVHLEASDSDDYK